MMRHDDASREEWNLIETSTLPRHMHRRVCACVQLRPKFAVDVTFPARSRQSAILQVGFDFAPNFARQMTYRRKRALIRPLSTFWNTSLRERLMCGGGGGNGLVLRSRETDVEDATRAEGRVRKKRSNAGHTSAKENAEETASGKKKSAKKRNGSSAKGERGREGWREEESGT